MMVEMLKGEITNATFHHPLNDLRLSRRRALGDILSHPLSFLI
jgi:hypothetical protein